MLFRSTANEPENILSLYFVQKLMSDVRFRSFQPMISAELQKKILKMVLPKLKNQFKINRLVDFNPIGVADEEIEILNKESVTDVGTFVKTLDDGKVCKEIENLQIDKVSFYCLRVVYEGKCVYLLRQFSKMKKLRSGLLTHFINDELVEMESDFLGLDEDVDMVLCEDSLVILNHISLERIFNYRDAYKAKTDEAMGAILTQGVLVNIEQFADDCSRDVRIMKRFTNIMSKGRLPLFFDNYDKVEGIVKDLGLDIEFDENGKLIYREKSQLYHIVNLMSDAYFKSLLAERIGVSKTEDSL